MRRLEDSASATHPPTPFPTLVDLLRARALEKPGQAAYVFLNDGENESGRLSYAELHCRARTIAAKLQASGVAGGRALLLFPPGLEFIASFFGCLYAGVVAVPVYPPTRQHLQRLQAVIHDASPAAILTTAKLADRLRREIPGSGEAWQWLEADTLAESGAEAWTPPDICADSLAFLQYTSGSTGDPKGVMVSHRNLLANQDAIRHGFGHTEASTVVGWLPLYHDMGLIGNILQPLYVGATAVLMPPMAFLEKPIRWLKAIADYRAATSGGPDFAYALCLRKVTEEQKRGLDLSSWTLAFNGAEPVRAATLERFAEAFAECGFRREAFFPCYGLAEATLFVSGERLQASALPKGPVSCGKAAAGQAILIVDPQSRRLCAAGEEGEIWVSGANIAQGYWNRLEASEQTFRATLDEACGVDGHFLRTGDLGLLREGRLHVTGRIKDLIIIRGRNYYPQDIEQALSDGLAALRPGACAAFAAPDTDGERLVVVAELTREAMRGGDFAAIFAAMRKILAEDCELAAADLTLVQPGAVAKTSSGKIRRQACRQAYLDGTLPILAQTGAENPAPAQPGEEPADAQLQWLREALPLLPKPQRAALIARFLADATARTLKLKPADITDGVSLVALGLDSLKAVELKHSVEALLGDAAPVSLFLSEASLRGVAERLAEALDAEPEALAPAAATAGQLSATQSSMWAMQHIEPDSSVYNLHLALRIDGPLDPAILRRAFVCLAGRHPLLRTVYRDEDGTVRQQVLAPDEAPDAFAVIDAESWPEARLQDAMAGKARQAFDLARGPVFDASLYRHGPAAHTLLLCAHHIALDLWSLLLILDELKAVYAALLAGREPALPALAASYADFVAWQAGWVAGPRGEAAWRYWQSRLSGELPLLALPTDHPRTQPPRHRGAAVALRLDAGETQALKDFAKRHGVTLFTLLLAAYKTLLHRHTHQSDLIVGVPGSGRGQARFAPVVGNFVNPLPIRTQAAPNLPFADYLAQVRDALAGAVEHQDFPFSTLVERLQLARDADHWPVYQTLFVLQQAQAGVDAALAQLALGEDGEASAWGDCQMRPLALRERVENFDLKLMAAQCQDGLLFSFQYRQDLFNAETVARWSGHFKRLLAELAQDDSVCLGAVPLLADAEQRRLAVDWNATAADYEGASRLLHQWFEAQAEKTPDAIALEYEGQRLSYQQLNAQANRLAHALAGLGVGLDEAVGVCALRSIEMVTGLLGVLKAGAAYVPLDPDYPADRLSAIAQDAKLRKILTQPGLEACVSGCGAEILRLDAELSAFPAGPTHNPDLAGAGDSLAYVLFTSGSTGRPKGVGIPHRGIVNRLLWMQDYFRLDQADAVLQKTPYSFDVSGWEFFWPLLAGARLVIAAPGIHKEPERLREAIEAGGITTLHFVPSMLAAFIDSGELARCGTLRRVICSGEALSSELRQRFFAASEADLYNLYGPTEASIDVTAWACERWDHSAQVPIGHPIANTQIYLLDAALNPVPLGAHGELCIGGVQLARGYQNRPDLTAERFVPDPFTAGGRLYRTGDLARHRPDGAVEYLGRIDHQVKIRGFRIELGEIEARLKEYPGVQDAVVLACDDGPDGKRLVAYWVGAAALETADWRGWLVQALPEYMVPAAFLRLDRLPVTGNGKLDRKALPKPDLARQHAGQYLAPRNATEQALATIWAEVLRLDAVGIKDNFFNLGGDSILAIQVAGRARREGLALTPRQLFQHQTIASLATVAGRLSAPDAAPDDAAGELPLTPIQQWFFSHVTHNPRHWNQSVLLEFKPAVDEAALEQAIEHLSAHHAALRLRFRLDGERWRQFYASAESAPLFCREDFTTLADDALAEAIASRSAAWQQTLDIAQGPLLRAVWFDTGPNRPARLLLAIHHLAVDAVSWRILLDDLQQAYAQLAAGQAAVLPPPTASFKRWATHLAGLAASDAIKAEAAYWNEALSQPAPTLPVDLPEGGNTWRTVAEVRSSQQGIAALLFEAAAKHRVRVDDLLLTALAETLAASAGTDAVLVDLERHGRDGVDLDLSRSVGWFTSLFPLRLALPPETCALRRLLAVKEALRGIPSDGIGYGLNRWQGGDVPRPVPQVLFNYLGRLDLALPQECPFALAEPPAASSDPENPRSHEWEILMAIAEGGLQLRWRFSRERYHRETLENLSRRYLETLDKLLSACAESQPLYAPSDFPLAGFDQLSLDKLLAGHDGVEDIYPLTPLQQGIAFHAQTLSHTETYVEQLGCVLRNIDPAVLNDAWQNIINRHTVLRSAIVSSGLKQAVQIVYRQCEAQIVELDWRQLSETEQKARWEQYLATDRKAGFALEKPPLMRLAFARCADEKYYFLWTYHHILLDGWSCANLLAEVFAEYESLAAGAPSSLPAVRPFRDYVEWLENADNTATEDYWKNTLRGFETPTFFSEAAASRPGEHDRASASHLLVLSAAETVQIHQFVRKNHLTLNTLIQGIWALLLNRHSGCRDVLFGITVSGRSADIKGIDAMAGLFINTLPLRVSVVPDAEVLVWLKALLEQTSELYQHEHVPLVKLKGYTDVPGDKALFESHVVVENYPLDEFLGNQLSEKGFAEAEDIHVTVDNHYPLSLAVTPGDTLKLVFAYARQRFDEAAVAGLAGHFVKLLQAVVAQPREKLANLPLLGDEERARLLADWNLAEASAQTQCLHHLFEAQADAMPQREALAAGGQRLSYSELNARANRLAHYLKSRGVGPEVRVGLCVERSPDMVVGILAVLKAGGAYVPVDPAYPRQRIEFLLQDSSLGLLLTQSAWLDRLPDIEAVCLDKIEADIAGLPTANPASVASPHNAAYVIYTSGSTGMPKGVVVSHANALHSTRARFDYYPEPVRRFLLLSSFAFDSSVAGIFWTLCQGGCLVLPAEGLQKDPKRLAETIGQQQISHLLCLPSLYGAVLEHAGQLDSLSTVIVAGEACPREVAGRHLKLCAGTRLYNEYGPTECAVWSSVHEITAWDLDIDRSIAIGRAIAGARVCLLDADLNLAPLGTVAEVYIGGGGVARGYLDRPALTAERFIPDPFGGGGRLYRSGDLARWREDGNLEFCGRADHQVKIRGFRIEPEEIEARLLEHPAVKEAAVIVREPVAGDLRLYGYAVPSVAAAPPEPEQLRDWLRQRLPEYMVPVSLLVLERFPLTANGKLDRHALPMAEAAAPAQTALDGATEERLAEIWREVLGVEAVGPQDNFFDLGGHSLSAIQVIGRIADCFGVEVGVTELFDHPTLAALADIIARERGAQAVMHEVDGLLLEAEQPQDSDMEDLLLELERLPEEEALRLLRELED